MIHLKKDSRSIERLVIFFKIYKIDVEFALLKVWNRDQYYSGKIIFVMIRCLEIILFWKDPPENKINTNYGCNSKSDGKLL